MADNDDHQGGGGGGGGGDGAAAVAVAAAVSPEVLAAQHQVNIAQAALALDNAAAMSALIPLVKLQTEQAAAQAAELALDRLKKPESKEMARYITALSESKLDAGERTVLAKAFVEMIGLREEDDEDLDEPLRVLKTAVKKVKSMTTEQKDDMIDRLKPKKRKAMHCSICLRDTHTDKDCHAKTDAHGTPLAGRDMKRQRSNGFIGGAFSGPIMGHGYGYAQQQQQQMQMQMQQMQQGVGVGAGGVASNLGGPSLSLQGLPMTCYSCGQHGHKSFECPGRRHFGPGAGYNGGGGFVRGAPGGQGGAGIPPAPGTKVSAGTAATQQQGTDVEKVEEGAEAEAESESDVMRVVGVASSVLDAYGACFSKSGGDDTDGDRGAHESLAAVYAEGGWRIEDEEEAGEAAIGASAAVSALCACAAGPSTRVPTLRGAPALYTTSLESDVHTGAKPCSTLDVAPVLSTRCETKASMWALEREGEEIMPAGARSLRGAMAAEFGGKKKMLSDEEVLKQTCTRCKKLGHTAFSCPDQTQAAAADRSASDAWVRRLMELPKVDVAVVNAGLTLAEGVARWKARGEELNRGNPWAGSTKMEDSLKKMLGYHKAMGMGSVHLGWIGFGVPLQFIEEKHPKKLAFRNHPSAMEEEEFVEREHASNVKDGSYVKVPREHLKGICPLQVVKHPVSGKKRLVQDLRWINGHLPNVKFRMESLHKELGDVVQPMDKLFTTDIAKAYYCLAMHPDAQQYLGWEWKGEYYMPTCLVFGLAPAPRIFTKIMRPMMAFMRSLGVRVLGMIDDYLWAEKEEAILGVRAAVQTVLPLLGWSFNAKCEWNPSDEVLMLGMLVNAKKFEVRAPPKKIAETTTSIVRVLEKQRALPQRPVTIKDIQRVTGRLMSMMLALPGVRVFTRSLYQAVALALEGNEKRKRIEQPPIWTLQLKKEAIEELEFWLQRMVTHNGLEINCRENQVQMLLWSDASDVGYGGEAAVSTRRVITGWGVEAAGAVTEIPAAEVVVPKTPVAGMAHGLLPFGEIARSSTRRELIALMKVASTPNILEQIRGKRIRVIMDSIPALRNLIKGGGPVPELCAAVKEWAQFCETHNIRAVYEWVERAANWRADEASKLEMQQHTLRSEKVESDLRRTINAIPTTQWRPRNNHFVWGKVPLFMPMFHQVDARVEMIRSQLEEAVIIVPRWPAGGAHDWWRRVVAHSIARVSLGKASGIYKERPQTGHDDELEAFWLMGRRGEKNRAKCAEKQ